MSSPENRSQPYAHGYHRVEQERLVAQSRYWRETIFAGVHYSPGERVLEIGCGVGAVLELMAETFPGAHWSGIDLAPAQIEFAREHLAACGCGEMELRIGNAASLPWSEATFDHVYAVWMIEHLVDPLTVLTEARRVLKPGGTIRLMETDYISMRIGNSSPEYERFLRAFACCFERYGDPRIGCKLGLLLDQAGFREVQNVHGGLSLWHGRAEFRRHVDYLCEFIEPMLAEIESCDCDPAAVRRGYELLRGEPDRANGFMTHSIFRAFGVK